MTITRGILKEKLHSKEIYIVTLIGIFFILFFSSANMELTIQGEQVTSFANLVPVVMTILWFLSGAFSIVISVGTIPGEYKRRTSHLVWVRKISQTRYHGGLLLGNILTSFVVLFALYISFAVFVFVKGGAVGDLVRLPLMFVLSCLPVTVICVLTTIASVKLPTMVAGLLSLIVLIAGTSHPLLISLSNTLDDFSGTALRVFLLFIPDLYTLQEQACNLLFNKDLNLHSLLGGLLMIYVLSHLLLVLKRKEA